MSIEAMKAIQMVYANTTKHDWPDDIWDAICRAIKAEKHEVSQEPVAWQDTAKHDELVASEDWDNIDPQWHWMYRPLYTHPKPNVTTSDMKQEHGDKTAKQRHEWVGLTHEEIDYQAKKDDHAVYFALGALWAEAKLKDKNGF